MKARAAAPDVLVDLADLDELRRSAFPRTGCSRSARWSRTPSSWPRPRWTLPGRSSRRWRRRSPTSRCGIGVPSAGTSVSATRQPSARASRRARRDAFGGATTAALSRVVPTSSLRLVSDAVAGTHGSADTATSGRGTRGRASATASSRFPAMQTVTTKKRPPEGLVHINADSDSDSGAGAGACACAGACAGARAAPAPTPTPTSGGSQGAVSGPITITAGGTYSGTYESPGSRTPLQSRSPRPSRWFSHVP